MKTIPIMHLRLLIFTCLSLLFLQLNSFAQIRQNIYGGNGNESINSIIPSPNGFMMCGSTTSSGAGQADVLVMEVDNNGAILWANTYGGINDDIGYDITSSSDGGYAIVGSSKSVTPFNEQAYVLKIEADGTVDWQKFIGNDNSTEKAYTILQVSLNGYLLGGSLQSGNNTPNAWIAKLRWNGQSLLWSKALGNTGTETIYDLQQKPDGTIVATGVESSFTGNGSNMLLLEIDEANGGNLLRSLSIGSTNEDIAYRNVLTDDGGYLLYGKTLSCGGSTFNEVAVKLDASGTLSWTKTLGAANDDGIIDMVELSSGNFAFASSYRNGNNLDIQLVETNQQGDVLSAYSYGSEGDESVENVESPKKMLVGGNNIIMVTQTNGFDGSGDDMYLLQTDLSNADDCNSEVLNISSSDCAFSNTAINASFNTVQLPIAQDVFILPVSANVPSKPVCCELEAAANQNLFTICNGKSTALSVDALLSLGTVTYSWSPVADLDNALAAMPNASPSTNTTYFVTISDDTGCTATAMMDVEVLPTPVVDLGENIDECEGTDVVLMPSDNFDFYMWQDGSTDPSFTATVSGTYTVSVSNANGCLASDEIEVNFEAVVNPTIDFGADTIKICEGESTTLEPGEGFESYLWSDSSTEPQLTVDESGTYQVEVFTNCGSGSASVIVAVENCDEPTPTPTNQQRVIVPTAFSPNDDGINDQINVFLNQGVELVNFVIYNRSGEPVFSTSNPLEAWDGFFKNDKQNIGIYPYYLQAVDRDDRDKPLLVRGNITLIR
ncbi:MAG: gliding motility-associated C-terminal domain-containing protein [Chitinophagales bacterium]